MPRFAAFLRAVNVGGRVVKMDRLRALFQELDLANVHTFIASGNVVFDSRSRSPKTLECKIEQRLRDALGYDVATFVRSTAEIVAIRNHQPFPSSELSAPGHGLYIAFLRDAPAPECAKALLDRRSKFDDFHVNGREVYWLCRGQFSDSPLAGPHLERILKTRASVRNSTTIQKLIEAHFDER